MSLRSFLYGGIEMAELDREEDIQKFIRLNQLDTDLLDERDKALEAWRLKWEGLAKGFMNYLQDRFSAIEQRLDGLEQLEGKRCGYRED